MGCLVKIDPGEIFVAPAQPLRRSDRPQGPARRGGSRVGLPVRDAAFEDLGDRLGRDAFASLA
jgi:hypothetical protein